MPDHTMNKMNKMAIRNLINDILETFTRGNCYFIVIHNTKNKLVALYKRLFKSRGQRGCHMSYMTLVNI